MKVKINKAGILEVNNNVKNCPFDEGAEAWCGDWCALFKEPIYQDSCTVTGIKSRMYLNLCRTQWHCKVEDFTDERKKEEPNAKNP
ncbi:hypothetical protein LCGC14_0739390 [marine sediment metagenome]|uniref:Uncharacterized protein n=1 Tax=marine sediment metagenome TaxID=412755 RepID=A0A0F9QS72_9ZZZZ